MLQLHPLPEQNALQCMPLPDAALIRVDDGSKVAYRDSVPRGRINDAKVPGGPATEAPIPCKDQQGTECALSRSHIPTHSDPPTLSAGCRRA